MKAQIRGIYAKGNMIYKNLKKCSMEVKIHLFKTYCSNLYCAGLWIKYKKSVFTSLQTAYKKAFRMLTYVKRGQTTTTMVNNNVTTFEALLRKSGYSIKTRITQSDNSIIKVLTNSVYFLYSNIMKH